MYIAVDGLWNAKILSNKSTKIVLVDLKGISTTIMINMPAVEHAINLAKNYQELFIGQHTNFVLGRPCADPKEIPSMIDKNGYFYRSEEYRLGRREFKYNEAKIETIAQMNKFKELTGYYPEHIEGHATGNEAVDQAFLAAAKEFGIHTSVWNLKDCHLDGYMKIKSVMNPKYMQLLNRGTEIEDFINNSFGILDVEDDEVLELHFHRGYVDQFILDNSSLTIARCKDLETLCDKRLKIWIKDNSIELVSFGDLKIKSLK